MLKALKDTRRRTVETIFQKTGISTEVTHDPEYEVYAEKFHSVIQELNQCSASLNQTIASQKTLFSDYKDMSHILQRIYQSNYSEQSWPESSKQLQFMEASEAYKQSWDNITDVIKSSVVSVSVDDALHPIQDNATKLSKTIEEECNSRRISLKDYDSYRRRLKNHQAKRDAAEAQGKANTPAHAAILAEIQKFEAKVQISGDHYVSENKKTKEDILFSKEKHDDLIDNFFLTMVVSQAELFSRAYEKLNDVIKLLPQEKVDLVKARIQETIMTGGAQIEAQPKGGLFNKVLTPRVSDIVLPSRAPTGGSTRALENISKPSPTPQIIPLPVAPAVDKKEFAIALFDNEVDDEEELAFKIGDRIEVIEKDEENGWPKGRLNGRVGLFPVNYVKFE